MTTISQAVIDDHRELEKYYNEVVHNANDYGRQQRFGNQFIWDLARHSVGEELVVYPALEKHLGAEGKEMAEHDRKEHHSVKQMLEEFQEMSASDTGYVDQLKKIWGSLSDHMKEEEERDLPALEGKLQSFGEESSSMAKSFRRTKLFVPTRSHPSAGEHPPFETAMGLLAAPIDKVADLFRTFPDREEL
ncbi:HHE domain containing protein [Metarhizium album ARSEF 1941]|uniref:HHE domain containing protein n=1 Tax=Metarhizium album (strain ARSEF 1941) TaxID=1081103 RepID=A0A0B2WVP8_METAS|nr:HHE domain containing protein [Metarhizium album ARSEF 1941]KHN97527.1 HHE domain containing protein [Metarhizium album ARSEF 1941]